MLFQAENGPGGSILPLKLPSGLEVTAAEAKASTVLDNSGLHGSVGVWRAVLKCRLYEVRPIRHRRNDRMTEQDTPVAIS